jgi:hypothetical protein
MAEPWERMPDEPARAYALFEGYLGLGPGRSLRQLADMGGASLAYLKELSSRWRWRRRAAAYQAQVARTSFPAPYAEKEHRRERLLREVQLVRRLAWAQTQQRLAEGTRPTGRELARLLRLGVNLELLLSPVGGSQQDSLHPAASASQHGGPPEEETEWDQGRHEEDLTPEEAMGQLLMAAQEAGVPEDLLPDVDRTVRGLLAEMGRCQAELGREPGDDGNHMGD